MTYIYVEIDMWFLTVFPFLTMGTAIISIIFFVKQPINIFREKGKPIDNDKFTINSHIVELKTEKQFRIIEIDNENNILICSLNGGITTVSFTEDEIELFSIWVEKFKKA